MRTLETLVAHLQHLYETDEGNWFEDRSEGRLFEPPFVGVAAADDAWFGRFKELIGDFYWTPQEALSLVAPKSTAQSVVCWCLPVSPVARKANRAETRVPAREWAFVRTFGEKVNTRLRHGLESWLREQGLAALAPAVAKEHHRCDTGPTGIASCWSERHTAFVAGLGTFGISGGLLTARGVAHRLGSVVTNLALPATPRPYGDAPFAWCLRSAKGTCGLCRDRCPTTSLGETVHQRDKNACATYQQDHVVPHAQAHFGWEGIYGCGLCQTGVPCEDRNPVCHPPT